MAKRKIINASTKLMQIALTYQELTNTKPATITEQIRRRDLSSKLTAVTLYNWYRGKTKPNLDVIDQLEEHFERNGFFIEIKLKRK